MSEYISREAVLEKAKSSISVPTDNEWDCGYNTAMAEMREFIKQLPSADVQPVKRGRWEQIGEQSAKCTACGGVFKSNGIDKTGKALIFNAVYHYCPYCGARMTDEGR